VIDIATVNGPHSWQELVDSYAEVGGLPMAILGDENSIIAMSNKAHELFGSAGSWHEVVRIWGTRPGPILTPVRLFDDTLGQVVSFPLRQSDEQSEAARLLSSFLESKAYQEYELNSLSQEILDKYEEVNLLYDLSEELGAIFQTERVYEIILERGIDVIGVEQAAILITGPSSQTLRLAASYGLPDELSADYVVSLGQGVAGTVALTGEALLVDSVPHIPANLEYGSTNARPESILSPPLICAPIQAKDRLMGVIAMGRKSRGGMFTAGDLKLLSAIASLAAVSIYNSELVAELRDSERVKRELEIAQSIQMGLLPGQPPSVPGVDLSGRCVSATNVGGDYYDSFVRADGTLGLVVADVSGHSVGAALMMAVARSVIRSETKQNASPAEVLRLVNETLFEDLDRAELFISAFYALYDPKTRSVRFANGGHCTPIVKSGRDACSHIDADGMLIGVLPSVEFDQGRIPLHPGDAMVLYTDGVIEAENEVGERYGDKRLHRLLERTYRWSATKILNAIFTDVEEFCSNRPQSDDMTVLVVKGKETNEQEVG
jgi:serine phosphatase RsbU (regulator of sigma subunit)